MIKKVLLVDDDPNTHRIHEYFLKKYDYQLLSAYSGPEGLQIAERETPHVILLDFMMPDMDGEDVLRYIDQNEIRVGVIIITGHPDSLKDRKLLNRAYDYIVKPFDLGYLNSTVLTKVVLLSE